MPECLQKFWSFLATPALPLRQACAGRSIFLRVYRYWLLCSQSRQTDPTRVSSSILSNTNSPKSCYESLCLSTDVLRIFTRGFLPRLGSKDGGIAVFTTLRVDPGNIAITFGAHGLLAGEHTIWLGMSNTLTKFARFECLISSTVRLSEVSFHDS